VSSSDLPEIEVLSSGQTGDLPAGHDRSGWQVESWRAHPVAAAAAVVVLLASVAAVVVPGRGDERGDEGRGALRAWASAQHDVGDPPAGVVLPEVTCGGDPYDLGSVRACLRDAQRSGEPAGGHLRMDSSYPDALDHWIGLSADGRATIVERVLTVTHRPDVEGSGEIRPWQLTTTTLLWRTWECQAVVFWEEVDLYPGVECRDAEAFPVEPPAFEHSERRDLTDAERQELVRAFACTHPEELSRDDC
jgi:hypothetical protein